MEILQKFKKNGFFTADLYHLLTKKKMAAVSEEITPSEYAKEMKRSTIERLQVLNSIAVDNIASCSKKNKKIVLSFVPAVIVFQNFKMNEKYVAKFCVKNISQAPTYISMVWKESSVFFIKPCSGQLLSRLAPGISITFAITFQPVQYEDYIHKVKFYTDTDQYILPIIAMGPRPMFDFPDEICIPKTPLKIENHVVMTIHNQGLVPAGFTLNAKCPFSVQPKSAYLHPDENIDFKVSFKTMHLGDNHGVMYAVFETGENFRVNLRGTTHTVSVELEKQVVRFLDTYNTMVRQQTFKITNKSNHLLTYMCMKNESVFYDFEDKVKLAMAFYDLKDVESTKSTKLLKFDVVSSDEHERVYTRIFYDEVQALIADETIHFQNMHFSVTPIKGKLWPEKSTEIVITFSPKVIGEFEATVYLDIDGITDRVPLKLVGTSLPPTISLNLETLDMDCVYINKTYNYEIVAINRGHINGVIVYKGVPPLFGSVITCTPQMHCLRPGEKQIFVISFCNSNQGPYFEEINFQIRDTEVVLKLYLKGVVIYPSLTFSIPCLDFGMVSVGVPKSLEVDVVNESIVHVNGSLKISSDGPEISSITLTDYAVADTPKPQVPQWPREFCIEPAKISIEPESRISLKVTLTANLIRANQTSLELELEKSDSPPITLPVTFNAMIPEITPAPDINLRAAFLDFPYKHQIVINSNDFQGYFIIEKPEEESTLEVEIDIKEGMIEPNSTLCLPVTIKTSVLGTQEYFIRMFLFGLTNPVDICHITGCGVRPIVTCAPTALHWGQVKILNRTYKTLTLCNDSPVKVNFKATLVNRDGRWQINPTEGYIEPEGETDLCVNLYLIDADSYTNKALIQLEKVKDIFVPLSATGIGTSILIGDLRDKVNIGRHFTKIPLNHKVIMENCGTRMHALEWSEHYKAPKTKQSTTGFFNLEPRVFKMAAGEKAELIITGLSSKMSIVKEMWYLVGSVEGINKKELLLECQIIAEFVDPKIELSTSVIDFQYDFGPYSEYYKLTDILTIKNVSKLPLDFEISVKPPFAIIQKSSTYKIPPNEQHLCGCIYYNENDLNLPNITSDLGPQQSKLFIDYLTLKPVEPAKKSPFHFFQDINKIKLAFSLTHLVEERLEDQEVMKIQILFDTTKHLSLKSRVYCDLMKLKFKGHKNKDAIKLVGKINFPNIFIWSPRVDFQCILNGSIESRTIKIQNVTPLLACYKFNWKKYAICTTDTNVMKPDDMEIAQTSTMQTEPSVGDIHEIMACRTPTGSATDRILEYECLPKDMASTLPEPTYSLTRDEEEDTECTRKKIIKKIIPMINPEYETQFEWISKFSNVSQRYLCINDIYQLTPHRGLLKANEIQYIQIIFRPKQNMNVRAILECEVLGGPPESIIVTGQSSNLMYRINTEKVNFKIRSFHENAIENLVITNTAQLPFEYKTYLNEPAFEKGLDGSILNLIPEEKILEPEEELEIKIEVNPGVTGYFQRVFLLEIGHLPFIPIEVFGWGVIPQVYLSLPRPGIVNLAPELGYLAIPTLTPEYMESVNEFMKKDVTEHLNSPLTEKCYEDTIFNHNWHICSLSDGYPTTMDIELAIERMLLVNHVKKHPEVLSQYSISTKMGPIAGFITTPYVVDYGVIITGSTVQCTVEIINYGPIASKLHFAKGTNMPPWLGVKLCGKLGPGERGKLDITFSPTPNDFTELEQDVATSFNIEVPYGVTIPVHMKALCAVPYLVSNVASIDLGSVRCGNKIVCSIPLKNVGKPTCIWYVNLRLKTPGPNPMLVLDTSGKYEPGEGGWLSVAFKPTLEMAYEGLLIFRFHMNPIRLTIPVTGQGILPHVHTIGPNIVFPPTLPWAKTIDMYFGLTNPCPFPIELIIAHSDVNWKQEDEIYQLLYKYYNKPEEMLVPAIEPGAGLPWEVISFNQKFKERVKKCLDDEAAAMKSSLSKCGTTTKKSKSPKTPVKASPIKEYMSPRKFRTEAEIVADEMKAMIENNIDPLKDCLHVFNHISSETVCDKNTKGYIFIFHGSPCEELHCQEMAHSLGKKLGLPTVNFDSCIVEALCVCSCPAKSILTSAIHEMYLASRVSPSKNNSDDMEEDTDDAFDDTDDEFDIIMKKIEFIANNKNVGTPRSKASDKKKKKSPTSSLGSHTAMGAIGSGSMFHMELLHELLIEYLSQTQFQRGFVVDNLTSIVIKNAPLVLTTLIRCKQTIRNLHLILCHSDFYKWAQTQEESQRSHDLLDDYVSKVYDESKIEEIINDFEAMTEEEYDKANPELKSVYIAYGLQARRKKYFEKSGLSEELDKIEKTMRDKSKSLLTLDNSESKKKIKKDDTKAKPTSEFLIMNTKYNEYMKNTYDNLVNIANNWNIDEGDVAYPLVGFNGQLVGSAHKKVKKRSDVQLQMSTISLSERGFPVTLIMCPCLRYKQALLDMIANSQLVQQALKEEEKFDILKCPTAKKEYSVLLPKTFPILQHDESLQWLYLDEPPLRKCECNQLTDLNLLDDLSQDNVLNILSKWHCICGKKVTSSQTSTSEIPSASVEKVTSNESESDDMYPLPLSGVKTKTDLDSRIVLQPGDLVRCKYSFSPRTEGNFSVKRFIEVSGWPESRVDITVSGICDLPRLDSRPKKMFENFTRRTLENNVYKLTYLDDRKLFEFGPIFVGSDRIYEEEYHIDLKNSSLITTDVDIEFLEDTIVFQIDKTFIRLEPGYRDKLKISAAPAEIGIYNSALLFCIKDNPEVITVNIACSGVVPIVEILPLTKQIDYGKLLLYRREDDRLIVKNDSILPIKWKIRNAEEFVEDFIIAKTTGIVPRHDNQVVPITYIACRVGVINNKILIVDIYDEEGRGEPMITDTLLLSAECYDVMVECVYDNATEDNLNYGNVKVNSTVLREMFLLNRGRYNIYFKLKKVKNFPEPSLLRSFEAMPECGVIPPTLKLTAIEFECTPTTSMNLINVPAYICTLLDGSRHQVVVAKFPVCVTIASFYNTFTLFPLGELNFHIIPVGSGVLRDVILNNTSKCPVTYEIVVPPEYQPSSSSALPMKIKDNKIKNPPIKCGNFLIMNEDNLLAPGTSRTLQIQFFATAARTFEEVINFVISDTCPAEAQGVPLKLVGTGAIPTLDFWNLENTFREHLIVKSMREYKLPEPSPHCVFAEDSVTLHFFSVTVNTSHVAVVDLYNNGLVACALTMSLHYQSNSNQDIFSLDKYQTHIEPLLHKNLGIIFSPKALEEYRAVLEIKLKQLDNQEQSFKICLIGEGVIPRIRLVHPPLKHQRIALLQFPVTCLGSISSKPIRFKNVSAVKATVQIEILQSLHEERSVFLLSSANEADFMGTKNSYDESSTMKVCVMPKEVASIYVVYNPIRRGRTNCEVKFTIYDNPYEYFAVLCEAEAFLEDVILIGLEMLSMDIDLEAYKASVEGTMSTVSTVDSRKKSKSAPLDKKKSKLLEQKKTKKGSQASMKHSDTTSVEHSVLKYVLDFGGCELCVMQKRCIIMVNNSDKVYKFKWNEAECLVVKPSVGYISPGEEKDVEITFYAALPVNVKKEILNLELSAMDNESLTLNSRGTWDNRQTATIFDHNRDVSLNERFEAIIDEQGGALLEVPLETITMLIVYSAMTEYTRYMSTLKEEIRLKDTFIYQMREFKFKVENIGKVSMKIAWSFIIDEEFPARIDKFGPKTEATLSATEALQEKPVKNSTEDNDPSKVTLFSESSSRDSVDTWFEVDLPFAIEPIKACLKPNESKMFKVTFSPFDAFDFKVKLKSIIDNLDPYDQNISCKIMAKSLIPYVHLDIEESDYLTSGRRKVTGVALPPHVTVLEFNVLGSGCYKKTFNVINPTSKAYEFIFEMVLSEKPDLIPVHCNKLKGYVEGGSSTEVVFTFSPTAPGVYESQWKFIIPVHSLVINLMVVGLVKEPQVMFVPTILIIRNSLVGFTSNHAVVIKNDEKEKLNFEFKGNSLCNESGKTPVIIEPEKGVLKPNSETKISIFYTPIQDGPLSFKIFCSVTYLTKFMTLCVNALSHSIKPTVMYYLIGNEHILNSDAVTNIHLDKTASTYERTIPFTIKNDGSATFFFDWHFNTSAVKKYLQVRVEPCSGYVASADQAECTLYFTLKQVPVQAFPVTLSISGGPEYTIYLYAEIEKPSYSFSCMDYDFGKCIVNAPDSTYKKNIAFNNDDKVPLILDLNFANLPELFVQYNREGSVMPKKRTKISIYFRPKQVKEYEFKLQFWVNSLCEEIITIRGEGVPLLYDLYEGCQKSFDLGPVKVGEKITRQIDVMNHSKVPIDAAFIFRDMYHTVEDTNKSEGTSACLSPSMTSVHGGNPGQARGHMLQQYKDNKVQEQIEMDIQNALSSLKVIPNRCVINPYRRVPLKIQFKPIGMISNLNVQLNMKVFDFERPLVRLSGSATGMSLCLSQNSLQFGRVRKRGCKILKVMLQNKGDFGTRFCWQPLKSNEFKISPMQGNIAAHTNVTFTITFRPINHNPFIKVWASCNLDNYKPLELALYATCMDVGNMQNIMLYLECPVREIRTEYVNVTNPTDDMWLVLSEMSGGPFETLREFQVEPNSTFNIPIHFKPKIIGKHESQILFSPLGDRALYVSVVAIAQHPNPNGVITFSVPAKEFYTKELLVHNITEFPESYGVTTEIVKIVPEKFEGYYEIKHPESVKVWGEAAGTCRWSFVCYEECEIHAKVLFINEETREYQYYDITAAVTPSKIVDTLTFVSRARETVQKDLIIVNPLSSDAEFFVNCEKLQCPGVLKISRNSEATLVMTYSPLVVGESVEYLEVTNQLVGCYLYKVMLKCLPAKEKNLEFTTTIGSNIPLRLRVENKTDLKTDFYASVSHPSILTDREYSLGPHEKGKFQAWFEPTELGVQNCKVSFDSLVAGEFVFNIKGKANHPKPQGPYEIKPGGFTTIKFKNVFQEARMFKIQVDREEFYIKTTYEPVKPKKDLKIMVYLNEMPARIGAYIGTEMPTGSLTIETYEPPEPKVLWTYFLQGIP